MAVKITDLTPITGIADNVLLELANDPGGVPESRSITWGTIKSEIGLYSNTDITITGTRTIDQDGNPLIHESDGTSFWQVDGTNDGLYYDYNLKRGSIGTEFPNAKWQVKGNAGQDIVIFEDSGGVDLFTMESSGATTIVGQGIVDQLRIHSTGGNVVKVRNNSNVFDIRSQGANVINGGNGAGAGIIVNGTLSGAQTYTNLNRSIQIVPNVNAPAELMYAEFSSVGALQTAIFGSSDAEGQRFDTWDVFSELSTYHGSLRVNTTVGVFSPPIMTAVQGTALTPTNGDMIYVTTTDATFLVVGFHGYEAGAWVKL